MQVEPAVDPEAPVVADYRLVRTLGSGGMGTVWLGHDVALDRPVALKFLSGSDSASSGVLREARALARVHHPNVVAVYRVGEVDGRAYIAYEYIDGVSLEHAATPLPWRVVLDIALGLARGLAAVHRQGVLHCDIKPANIVLTRAGEPKLIDFGIARVRRSDDDGERTWAFGGTPLYMAPELWHGQPFSESTDLYALGLVLHELLAGPLPQQALRGDEMITFLANREVTHLGPVVAGLPVAFADLVARLTATSALARTGSAEALVDSLEVLRSLYRDFVADDPASADQQRLVDHFHRLRERQAEIGRHFYAALFARHPQLRPLFPAELAAQQRKLEDAIELVVQRLGASETLVPLLEDLGRRHAGYGAQAEHFEAVGHQLLATLEALSGDDWSEALRRAWAHAYDRIAHVMVRGLDRARSNVAATQELVPATEWDLPVGPPPTCYARNGQISLAYQVLGEAPLHLVVVPDFVSHLEVAWEHPPLAAFLRRLSSFATVILVDKRGTGLSDRVLDALSLDEQVADLDAVLDAVGVDRAAIVGLSAGCALAGAYAAKRPERTRALALYGATDRLLAAPDHPHGVPAQDFAAALADVRSRWGEPLFLEQVAPSLAGDPGFRGWWARYLRASASPGAAEAALARLAALDLSAVFPEVDLPTLVLHRTDDAVAPITGARRICRQISGARLCELAGADHLPFIGDADAIVGALRSFLAALPDTTSPATAPVTTVAIAAHDPACSTAVRALFERALAGAGAVSVDSEAMTAELGPGAPVSLVARTVVTAARLRDLPVSAAVITAVPRDMCAQLEQTRTRARAAAPGTVSMNPLARELSRGARPVPGEDEPPL